ncbi:MAG: ATP-dependent sacrificial sulfur transferase LarE [Candidatus Hydrothermarchaeota archaeon]
MLSEIDEKLREMLSEKRVAVALSGGVDSSLVTALSKIYAKDVVALTVDMEKVPSGTIEDAREIAKHIGVEHRVLRAEIMHLDKFVENPPDRCYHCKKVMWSIIADHCKDMNIDLYLDGTNADELKEHRPGIIANREFGVISPLAELGLKKRDIRKLARELGLPNHDKPSNACLSSRVPYNTRISKELLERIDKSEAFLRNFLNLRQVRVRVHENLARIEVEKEEMHKFFDKEVLEMIHQKLEEFGFKYICLDLRGYRSGSMDEVL